ncbi:MAG: hypothetical protein RL011_1473 [Pseudomonadota bacterium]
MLLERVLQFFAKVIETELGIVYSESNYFQLENRLQDIARQIGTNDIYTLYEQAKDGLSASLKQLLLDVATNNETSFFRDPKIFKAIENLIFTPESTPLRSDETLRIWSAACSTGQEPLSLAMMLKERQLKTAALNSFNILASDISERVLLKAKSGIYSQLEVQRGLPAAMMLKYFTKDDQDRWTATPEVRRHIEYSKVNLRDNFSFPGLFHLILCRNVLIYQNVEGKRDILKRITSALSPGGYLVLGSGESLIGLSDDFEHKTFDGAIVYRKKMHANLTGKSA